MGAQLIIPLSGSESEHDAAVSARSTAADCGLSAVWPPA